MCTRRESIVFTWLLFAVKTLAYVQRTYYLVIFYTYCLGIPITYVLIIVVYLNKTYSNIDNFHAWMFSGNMFSFKMDFCSKWSSLRFSYTASLNLFIFNNVCIYICVCALFSHETQAFFITS